MSRRVKCICVVGAGAAGLTSVKACLEEGLQVVCYEMTWDISGIWRYRKELVEGVGRVHKSTITNTSKEFNSFSDFPIPQEFPNYLHHKKLCEYFELYANHFKLIQHILFNHSVLKVNKTHDYDSTHRLEVQVKNIKENSIFTQIFDGVMVCTGLHAIPRWPHFPGQELFKGRIIHSREMGSQMDLCQYEDKRAVVVGIGNSGSDCAVELSNLCDKTYLALRRGGWILHRMSSNGVPMDCLIMNRFYHKLMSLIPYGLLCWYFETFVYNERFNHRLYGIEPKFQCFSEALTLNDVLPTRILSGRVIPKRNIERFTQNGIFFIGDKKETKCELVVMATGYHYSFPHIDKSLFEHSEDKAFNLYKQVFPGQLSHPSLALIGAVQPNGAIFPVFEMQSRWYAQLMAGKCQFPSKDLMMADIRAAAEIRNKMPCDSPRHSLTVDWISYMDDISDMIGVKPVIKDYLFSDLALFLRLIFGTALPYQYRLKGVHSWIGARDALMQSDYRMRYGLSPDAAKAGNGFYLCANFYKILFSFILFIIVYIVFDLID